MSFFFHRALVTLGFAASVGALARAQAPEEERVVDTAQDPSPTLPVSPEVPETQTATEARRAANRALDWLVKTQHEDGSWGTASLETIFEEGFSVATFGAWRAAAHGLAVMALLEAPPTEERVAALERAVDWLCLAPMPKRPSDWDVDSTWEALYGLVACAHVAQDPRFAEAPWSEKLATRGGMCVDYLIRNQSPEGGWAYYDDPTWSARPTWATSFCTALVLPALQTALDLGWLEDEAVRDRAIRYVRACAMPEGAYAYDWTPVPRLNGGVHINRIQGSLGRTQVCNWALRESGVEQVTLDRVREGLESFFEHHRFLDQARMKPIPHEGHYANAGYFYFFGHYYAAKAIGTLPEEEREAWHARLRPHLTKVQREDGSSSDFHAVSYMTTASTSFLALGLELGLPDTEEIDE